jgi:hypothetical protein
MCSIRLQPVIITENHASNNKFAINITSCKFAPAWADLFIVRPVHPEQSGNSGNGHPDKHRAYAITELINDKKLSLKQFPNVYKFSA